MLQYDGELLRLLSKVLRARDFHLYLENGKRLTDLWLSGGRAILGHKPPKVLRELKNAGERGLFSALPHPMERRFIKALEQLFPGRSFRLYMDSESLFKALGEADFSLWRPFLTAENAPILLPVLPWPLAPLVLVLEKSLDDSFPQGELIPPVLLAPAARALHDLVAEIKVQIPEGSHGLKRKMSNRGNPRYPKIEKVLLGKSLWQRQGIYLTVEPLNLNARRQVPAMEREEYEAMFRRFLEGGFLIPPSPLEPLILPGSMSPGEESKLAKLLASPNNM